MGKLSHVNTDLIAVKDSRCFCLTPPCLTGVGEWWVGLVMGVEEAA